MKLFYIFLVNLFFISFSHSAISMLGTRVILSEGANEKTLIFKNSNNNPGILQVWTDSGNEKSTINTENPPFIVNPQIFKMQEDTVQSVRLIFVDINKAPADRESLYFLNFMEIPMVKKNTVNENQLIFLFKNRIKIFYRPKGIKGSSIEAINELLFSIDKNDKKYLTIYNPTNFYINFNEIKVGSNNMYVNLESGDDMVSPKSTVRWKISNGLKSEKINEVKFSIVNDYGAVINNERKLN